MKDIYKIKIEVGKPTKKKEVGCKVTRWNPGEKIPESWNLNKCDFTKITHNTWYIYGALKGLRGIPKGSEIVIESNSNYLKGVMDGTYDRFENEKELSLLDKTCEGLNITWIHKSK